MHVIRCLGLVHINFILMKPINKEVTRVTGSWIGRYLWLTTQTNWSFTISLLMSISLISPHSSKSTQTQVHASQCNKHTMYHKAHPHPSTHVHCKITPINECMKTCTYSKYNVHNVMHILTFGHFFI